MLFRSIWGLYFFVLLMVEKFFLLDRLSRAPAAVGHVYTMFFVLVSWAIFAIEDAGHLSGYLRVMFGLGGVPLADSAFGYYLTSYRRRWRDTSLPGRSRQALSGGSTSLSCRQPVQAQPVVAGNPVDGQDISVPQPFLHLLSDGG